MLMVAVPKRSKSSILGNLAHHLDTWPRIPGIQPALNLQRSCDAHPGATALDPSLAAPRSCEPRHVVRKAGLTCRVSAT